GGGLGAGEAGGVEGEGGADAERRGGLGDARVGEDPEQRPAAAELLGPAAGAGDEGGGVAGGGEGDGDPAGGVLHAGEEGGREAPLEVVFEHRGVDAGEDGRGA